MRRAERGSALVVVLLMLMVLLPLTIILGRLVVQWQRRAAHFYGLSEMEYAARAGFEDSFSRLVLERLKLGLKEQTRYRLEGIGGHRTTVRVERQEDAVVSLDGRVLDDLEAAAADLERTGLDPEFRRVHIYKRLEVYLVEVRVKGTEMVGGVRLWGIVVRPDGGPWLRAGQRVDRGFF